MRPSTPAAVTIGSPGPVIALTIHICTHDSQAHPLGSTASYVRSKCIISPLLATVGWFGSQSRSTTCKCAGCIAVSSVYFSLPAIPNMWSCGGKKVTRGRKRQVARKRVCAYQSPVLHRGQQHQLACSHRHRDEPGCAHSRQRGRQICTPKRLNIYVASLC